MTARDAFEMVMEDVDNIWERIWSVEDDLLFLRQQLGLMMSSLEAIPDIGRQN
jgi:hypothetical protein